MYTTVTKRDRQWFYMQLRYNQLVKRFATADWSHWAGRTPTALNFRSTTDKVNNIRSLVGLTPVGISGIPKTLCKNGSSQMYKYLPCLWKTSTTVSTESLVQGVRGSGSQLYCEPIALFTSEGQSPLSHSLKTTQLNSTLINSTLITNLSAQYFIHKSILA